MKEKTRADRDASTLPAFPVSGDKWLIFLPLPWKQGNALSRLTALPLCLWVVNCCHLWLVWCPSILATALSLQKDSQKRENKKIPLTLETPVTEPPFSHPGPAPVLWTNNSPPESHPVTLPELLYMSKCLFLKPTARPWKNCLPSVTLSNFLKRKQSPNGKSKIIFVFSYSSSFLVYHTLFKTSLLLDTNHLCVGVILISDFSFQVIASSYLSHSFLGQSMHFMSFVW